MIAVAENLARLVAASPDPVVAADHVGARKPASSVDLPFIVIAVALDDVTTTGLGRVTRSGELPTQSSTVIDVIPSPETFSPDLRFLALRSPLLRSPASLEPGLGPSDVRVVNVSDPASRRNYRYASPPSGPDEFVLDAARARLEFGAPQAPGDRLEVEQWTVTWKDDIQGLACRGRLELEIWGGARKDVAAIARLMDERLVWDRALGRRFGFSRLVSVTLGAAERLTHAPPGEMPFQAWRQALAYRFAFEFERPAVDGGGGRIRRIDVAIDGEHDESLHIPSPTA